jgi:flagellar biosynthesis protein
MDAEPMDAEPIDAEFGPARRAAALSYGAAEVSGGRAPRVVAQGRGPVAEEIIERARAAGVPIHESNELVALLMQVDLDAHIPPALYVAVAEVLAWVYRLEKQAAGAGVRPAQPSTQRATYGTNASVS